MISRGAIRLLFACRGLGKLARGSCDRSLTVSHLIHGSGYDARRTLGKTKGEMLACQYRGGFPPVAHDNGQALRLGAQSMWLCHILYCVTVCDTRLTKLVFRYEVAECDAYVIC